MYEHAFSPLKIGGVEVANRLLRTGHGTALAKAQMPGEDVFVAYHLERAKDGFGLSILEGTSTHPTSGAALLAWDDAVIPQYRKLADAIAPTGMKLFQQLWLGGHSFPRPDGGPGWAPSAITGRYQTLMPIEMTTEQVRELIASYGTAAARVEAGGLDGAEVHAAHGYLIGQFLSPVLNRREDEYGGSEENRARFLVEVLRAVRAATSRNFAVGIRISANSYQGGFTVEAANALCLRLEAEGLVDFVNISYSDYYAISGIIGAMHLPSGYEMDDARKIGAGLKVPRMVAGRFATLDDVEQVLRQGEAEMVNLVRASIADPELIRKSRAGRAIEVRPCIGCNQGCLGGAILANHLGCTVNPAVGHELTLSEDLIEPAEKPRKVFIVGGGPAGMEAARVAALCGHKVALAEASSSLGGMLNYARKMPKLQALGDIGIWLEAEIYRLGVDVRLSTYVEADEIAAENPDVVIVATGSYPADGPIAQVALPNEDVVPAKGARVLNSLSLLDSRGTDIGTSALVLDDIGHYESIACCEELLGRGLDVTYVTRLPGFVPMMEATYRVDAALKRLHALGNFRIHVQAALVSIEPGRAEIRPIYSEKTEWVPADTVVRVDYRVPANDIWKSLRTRIGQVILVGDALSSRDLQVAIREGHCAAREIA